GLLEKQGDLQADSREARLAVEGLSRAAVLGERERARDGRLRSGPGEGRLAERDSPVGEREEVDPPGGAERLGLGGWRERLGGSVALRGGGHGRRGMGSSELGCSLGTER